MNPLLTSAMSLHWLRPQWLWLLVALPLLAWWWRARWRQRNAWRDAVDPHLLPHLLDSTPPLRRMRGPWLALLGTALAIAALAGPSWQRAPQPEWQNRAPLVIAVDLSTAVLATDLPPSRLLQARAKIARLLQSRAGGQVGLVVFADDAFTVAPLTDDVANVALFLDALAPDVMPVDGSRADRAIAWSSRLLKQAGFDHGDVLLLTDHADSAARGEATTASRQGYRVSVLGMGTPSGAAYRDAEGRIGHAALDASSLRGVASAGGGDYAAMTTNNDDVSSLDVLDPQHAGALSAQGRSTLVWLDQGYWLLPPLLVLGLLAFRRGRGLAVLLLAAWLPWQPAQAATHDWWRRPDQLVHDRIEQGAQAYRKGDFAAAQNVWRDVPVADAAYNRGNALARQGDYDQAIAAYDEALRLQPGMADALANRRAVDAARKRKPPSGKQSGQGKPNPRQAGNGQPQQAPSPQQGQSHGQPQDSGRNPGGQPSTARQPSPQSGSQPPAPTGAQTPKAADAAAQQQADAAQRARMQQALQQAKAGANGNVRGVEGTRPAETRAERERR
ncbi:MAG TPA: VWA domain-containing protein, partial [Luteimonas sp.]|nr:VWA domain-containing protein [Luteimonas sp.]